MAVCWVILRWQQIYTVIQAVHSLLYFVAKCHFFSVVSWKYIIKYLKKCEGCTPFCEILYTHTHTHTHIYGFIWLFDFWQYFNSPITESLLNKYRLRANKCLCKGGLGFGSQNTEVNQYFSSIVIYTSQLCILLRHFFFVTHCTRKQLKKWICVSKVSCLPVALMFSHQSTSIQDPGVYRQVVSLWPVK